MMDAMGGPSSRCGKPRRTTRTSSAPRRSALLEEPLVHARNGYAWTYRGDAWTGTNGEDISHAAINVDFAARLREANLVFTDADVTRFASTLFDVVHVDSATTTNLVDGTGGTNKYSPIAALWLGLSPYDARVWPVGANLYVGPPRQTAPCCLPAR